MLKSGTFAALALCLACGTSCKETKESAEARHTGPAPAPGPTSNAMAAAPEGLLASRAASPVHWQHWEPSLFDQAKASHRLVFAFVGSPLYPGCVEALDAIDRDPALVARLNRDFIPVLVDGSLAREALLGAALLSQEIKLPVSFPFILVLSPEGNEVTWRPVAFAPGADLRELFEGATDVVSRMWSESPDYVRRNSGTDHANRIARLPVADLKPAKPQDLNEYLARATRQLVSLYDEDIGSLAGTGGLLPLGVLQCLSSAALDPFTAPELATRSREAVHDFAANLLGSAMVDPLDGGIYSSRRGTSWMLPMPNRSCMTQARAARALITLHAATADPLALEVALGAVRFAEQQYAVGELFAPQRQPAATPGNEWLWTAAQIDEALSPPEAALWRKICGVADLGNLRDAGGNYFRFNSLGFRVPLAEAAAALGISPDEAAARLDSGRRKLLAAREARLPSPPPATTGSAAPSFRMVSAYAALFTATGDAAWRDKALALARRSRETFSDGVLLREQNPAVPAAVCDARAFTYALAIQAALDLAEVTLDESWRIWAGDLATTVAEKFSDAEGRLLEARPGSTPLQLPIEDRVMLFDDSTAGLMRMNLARLDALGQPPPPAIAGWISSLPEFATYPVVHTDSILAASFGRSRTIIELPSSASADWKDAACRLPLDRISRRIGKGESPVARMPDGKVIPLESPAAMARPGMPPAP